MQYFTLVVIATHQRLLRCCAPSQLVKRSVYVPLVHTSTSSSILVLALLGACAEPAESFTDDDILQAVQNRMPNNKPLADDAGFSASFHPAGEVALDGNYFVPQGTNGRHCAS